MIVLGPLVQRFRILVDKTSGGDLFETRGIFEKFNDITLKFFLFK